MQARRCASAVVAEEEPLGALLGTEEDGLSREVFALRPSGASLQSSGRITLALSVTLVVTMVGTLMSTGTGRRIIDQWAARSHPRTGVQLSLLHDKEEVSSGTCRMAKVGDECYQHVVWAMTTGINQNQAWYPGITKKSKFEDFQAHLSLDATNKCPPPCIVADCATAEPGTECMQNVLWVQSKGLAEHPEWYEDLTADATFEEIQLHIHKENKTACPKKPCNPQPFELQTLFCWAVVRTDGYELGLMTEQLNRKAGIFACDGYAVISDKELNLPGVKTLLIPQTQVSGWSRDGTSPNAPIFVSAWEAIHADGRYAGYKWVVKADPDTVLIPDRLRGKLSPDAVNDNPYKPSYTPAPHAGIWVPNCDKMANWGAGWGGGWPMMYGSIEIISREGLDNYYAHVDDCKANFDWQGAGEDAFMGLCLRKLQLGEIFLKQADNLCGGGGACGDTNFAAYHPKKDTGSWMSCWDEATAPPPAAPPPATAAALH